MVGAPILKHDAVNVWSRANYQKNKEKLRKYKREYMAKDRRKNPEKARLRRMNFYYKNRERQKKKMKDYYATHYFWVRAMHMRGAGRSTTRELEELWDSQGGKCALTGRVLEKATSHIDHLVPKCRGGDDQITNLRWVCKDANLAKRGLLDTEFFQLCLDVVVTQKLLADCTPSSSASRGPVLDFPPR